jgi:hypothetical protein
MVVGLALVVASGMKVSRLEAVRVPDSSAFPDPKILGAFSAGYGGSAASSMWIEVVMDYADILFDNKSMATFPAEIEAVTVLDPRWQYPFEFAGLVLDDAIPAHHADAVRLLGQGVADFPDSWRLRVYLAMILEKSQGATPDSLAKILLPVATDAKAPEYARMLAFTVLHKGGRPEEAMDLLIQTYRQLPDPLVRLQFRGKIGDLLDRNSVQLGADREAFLEAVGALLVSDNPVERVVAQRVLVGLVDPSRRETSIASARELASQYRTFTKG